MTLPAPPARGVDEFLTSLKAGDLGRMRELLDADPPLARGRVDEGTSLLMLTAYYRNPNAVDLMLGHGAPLGPFEAAVLGKQPELARHLDASPGLIRSHAPDGWTLLHLAGHFNQKGVAEFLLAKRADVMARSSNPNHNTPLHAAMAGQGADVARLLIERGADVNARDAGGHTPLHLASANNFVAGIEVLLSHGADPNVASKDGQIPLDLARKRGNAKAVALLERVSSARATPQA